LVRRGPNDGAMDSEIETQRATSMKNEPGRSNRPGSSRMSIANRVDQRFENWKLLRAPLRPYFLRSFMRSSRVR
jgi:hypothetical protein